MTGTYAGQYVMEGFLDLKIPLWARVTFTRLVAIGPGLVVAILTQDNQNLSVRPPTHPPTSSTCYTSHPLTVGVYSSSFKPPTHPSLQDIFQQAINVFNSVLLSFSLPPTTHPPTVP